MPQVSGYPPDELPSTSNDLHEFDESKPELWPLFLPSELLPDDRSLCHNGIVETEQTLRLAQVQDNLVDLRRLRRTLRSLRTYFKSNVVGEGQKTQTKSRTIESGVTVRINRTVRRYRLAYAALLSLDPTGDWRNEYLELTNKDNRGPGKELYEQGVGDGHYAMSWIWGGSSGSTEGDEVNETVRYEWMTCRARADRWREELDLLREEMRRVIAFLEWKSQSWGESVSSHLGSVTADIQNGIDAYARKQEATYHELAISLANQWIPHLLASGLDVSWAKIYPWATKMISPAPKKPLGPPNPHNDPSSSSPSPAKTTFPSKKPDSVIEPAFNGIGDESDDGDYLQLDAGDDTHDEGEFSDGLGIGFEYDDEYMS